MLTVGAYEAKTRLAELLRRVEEGDRVTITRHGRPVAILVPPARSPGRTVDEALEGMARFSEGRTLGRGLDVRDLIEEGRSR